MQPTAPTTDDVIDWHALRARCLGNVDLVDRVVAKFLERLDADLTSLERAIEASDATGVAQLAHRLKGMAANVEARQLKDHASAVEEQARDRRLAALPNRVASMRRLQRRLVAARQCPVSPAPPIGAADSPRGDFPCES